MPLVVVNITTEPDPAIRAQLDRIEAALTTGMKEVIIMTKDLDSAVEKLTEQSAQETTVIDSLLAYIDANVTAQRDLAAELQAQGVNVQKLNALADAQAKNRERMAAKILQGTSEDTGFVPPAQAS